jgi:hypothetical protein
MIMNNYQNAVSDKLTILAYPDSANLFICSKSASIKLYISDVTRSDEHQIKTLLSSSIFAKTTVIHCSSNFIVCPNGISESERKLHFQLSFNPASELINQALDEQVETVFEPHSIISELEPLLVNAEHITDVQLMHQYKSGLSRSNAIYFSVIDNHLLIRAYSASFLLLANRFEVESKDDIFYFIMLAVEQLKIDINSIHFEYIGSPTDYQNFKEMFKNYLPMLLNLPLLSVDTGLLEESSLQDFENDWLASVAVQCV